MSCGWDSISASGSILPTRRVRTAACAGVRTPSRTACGDQRQVPQQPGGAQLACRRARGWCAGGRRATRLTVRPRAVLVGDRPPVRWSSCPAAAGQPALEPGDLRGHGGELRPAASAASRASRGWRAARRPAARGRCCWWVLSGSYEQPIRHLRQFCAHESRCGDRRRRCGQATRNVGPACSVSTASQRRGTSCGTATARRARRRTQGGRGQGCGRPAPGGPNPGGRLSRGRRSAPARRPPPPVGAGP